MAALEPGGVEAGGKFPKFADFQPEILDICELTGYIVIAGRISRVCESRIMLRRSHH
jgi:hypothetical protein